MAERWLHLQELGGDPWILPIWGAANSATEKGRIKPLPPGIHALGPAISIKLNVIHCLIKRINQEANDLFAAAKSHTPEQVFSSQNNGYVLEVDCNLKYLLTGDIDALLFEVKSCLELMEVLVKKLYRHLNRRITANEVRDKIRSANIAEGYAVQWLDLLKDHRDFITHRGACYLAIDITQSHEYGLLIMKEILQDFSDSTKFFTNADLSIIAQGFMNNKVALRKLIIGILSA